MNNIDDETTQLRAVEMGLRAENENKPTFDVNEATKDTGIADSFDNRLYKRFSPKEMVCFSYILYFRNGQYLSGP